MVVSHADAGIAPGGPFAPPRDMVHAQAKLSEEIATRYASMSRLE